MHAHLVQLDIAWENRSANHARVRSLLEGTPIAPGDLILLPEMFDSGFSLNIETTADSRGDTARFLGELARSTGAWVHAGTTALSPPPDRRGLNRALTFAPDGSLASQYDKMHPFTYGREGERFQRGASLPTWLVDADPPVRFCSVICYDLRFPELFRAGLAGGTEVFTVVANWPAGRREHWRALCIARAIENQAIVLGVNRCGKDPHLAYLGGSIAADAQGNVVGEADARKQVLSLPLDLDRLRQWRQEFPAWRDQHPALWPPKGSGSCGA